MKMKYMRSPQTEYLRIILRSIDFLILMTRFGFKPRFLTDLLSNRAKTGQGFILVELGPGPCRLAWIKNIFFEKVRYLDISDYGINCNNLIIKDLSSGIPLFPDLDTSRTVYFADHCIEHLEFSITREFCSDFAGKFFFRIPNIRSTSGKLDFNQDKTHITSFDDQQLSILSTLGKVKALPWSRFYEIGAFMKSNNIQNSRELCIYRNA